MGSLARLHHPETLARARASHRSVELDQMAGHRGLEAGVEAVLGAVHEACSRVDRADVAGLWTARMSTRAE